MKFRNSLQPGNELSGKSGWKVPPTDDARLTVIDGVRGNEHLRYFCMVGRVYYESDDGQRLISINGSPLKVVFGGREEGWGRSSLI